MKMHEIEVELTSHFATYKQAAAYISEKLDVTQATALGWLNGDRTPKGKNIHALVQLIQDLEDEEANRTTSHRRKPRRQVRKPRNSVDKLDQEIEALKKKIATKEQERREAKKREVLRVSEKGAVSLYGLRKRYPITLYADEWRAIFKKRKQILDFIEENQDELE